MGGGPDLDAAIRYARERLERDLPSWLQYHDVEHTTELVVPAADLLCDELGLTGGDRVVVLTASWFHDLGFVERYDDNEQVAARLAREVLPGFGYSSTEVQGVADAIMATKVPQRPTTVLAEVVCDADLFVLGTDRFLDREQALREELEHVGRTQTDEEWARSQLAFLEAHRWFTEPASRRNGATKEANVALVRTRLGLAG